MLDGLGYLEDPRQTATPPTEAALPFGEPRGRHFATRRAPLHGVVAHGRPPPPELARLLLAWPRSRSAP